MTFPWWKEARRSGATGDLVLPRFKVDGMPCAHCGRTVMESIHQVDPGATVEIDLASRAVETNSPADVVRLADAIRAEGYQVQPLAA